MNHFKIILSVILMILLFLSLTPAKLNAQVNGYDFKYGISFHGLAPDTDFPNDKSKFSYLVRAFGRYELTNELELEFGAGFGLLAGMILNKEHGKHHLFLLI